METNPRSSSGPLCQVLVDDERDDDFVFPSYDEQPPAGSTSTIQQSASFVQPQHQLASMVVSETDVTKEKINNHPSDFASASIHSNLPIDHPTIDAIDNVEQQRHQKETEKTIRCVMTGAAGLLLLAASLTGMVALQYRFVLLCVWIILFALFVGFVIFVRETILCVQDRRGRRRVFHPAVHVVADWIAQEIHHFVEDCRDEYRLLLLANDPAFDSYHPHPIEEAGSQRRRQSRVFRVLVRPIMRWTWRGRADGGTNNRQRRRREKQSKESRTTTNTPSATHKELDIGRRSTYIPPSQPESELLSEMEMV
jgi:hypothetical protein